MKVTIQQLKQWKQQGRPITVLTAWDYALGTILDQSGVDVLLVGDSLAMVALGYDNTLPLQLDDMIHHAQAVCRGAKRALVVCDLPFLSYQSSPQQALESAGQILKRTGVQGVKLEGGYPDMAETVNFLVMRGIPVMGHVGLTPQSVHQLGGYRRQGRSAAQAAEILQAALSLEQAGAFAIVLEHIPADLAATITQKLSIPTIGIGAGLACDGQVLVTADILGLSDWQPPFAKVYLEMRSQITDAVERYCADVKQRRFPTQE
ncbi:3-methyl-2-oxobutanoate hydroxymethyltransferase [Synechococcales cyanobacterium C]|uniref:3-methyl-2-oxobutanoate hydroxymethyltransferase n=1 Tax=Petrachloros mirabilis ULC683 TaxID=2781853 RepID=A0A8K1ZYM4_9CYAN|nr:3-methyl-2-oxobutanoate hydroxymethyltransferase [Petrachloros mirabilis]NCJ07574.1 3-methyl-2-oxobutanoate hydroxymethyltransferase [Petrachloros mirabilis ULC683]